MELGVCDIRSARIALPFARCGNRQAAQPSLAVTPLRDTVSLLRNELEKVTSWQKQQHSDKRHTAKGVALRTTVKANGASIPG